MIDYDYDDVDYENRMCVGCQTTKNVKEVVDPYDEDVFNRKRLVFLCAKCEQDWRDDV